MLILADDVASCQELVDAVMGDGGTCKTNVNDLLIKKYQNPTVRNRRHGVKIIYIYRYIYIKLV